MVVLHYTAMQTADAARDRLCDPKAEVSAHYLISETGDCWALVDEATRAWHAGAGQWGKVTDVNSRSIGIELANAGTHPFPDPQMRALEGLLHDIRKRWTIPLHRIIAHSDMAPGRKSDPGPRFDWHRLARQGLSVWPDENPVEGHDPSWFRDFAQTFGYPDNASDADLLTAFRLRFRPWKTGEMDALDLKIIQNLAQRFPVDQSTPNT